MDRGSDLGFTASEAGSCQQAAATGLFIRGNLWIESAQGLKLGRGRAELLAKIEETGSIAEAARLMEMSYRRAWAMVKEMNQGAALPLVEKSAGGRKGGGATLTAAGKTLLQQFQKLMHDFEQFKTLSNQELQFKSNLPS